MPPSKPKKPAAEPKTEPASASAAPAAVPPLVASTDAYGALLSLDAYGASVKLRRLSHGAVRLEIEAGGTVYAYTVETPSRAYPVLVLDSSRG